MVTMIMTMKTIFMLLVIPTLLMMISSSNAEDKNPLFDPCSDAKIERWDGFTFGLAFSSKEAFFSNHTQLSPCDPRLQLVNNKAQLAVFRPKVDEISLLTINTTAFKPDTSGGYMVAFAGKQYAARSLPVFVADSNHTVTSFTLVLEFERGILQNLYWKKLGCGSCSSGDSVNVCLNDQDCAIPTSKCGGGSVDCNLSIQLTFSGTDKNLDVLNSWYEAARLRHYSLYSLFTS